MRHGMLIPVLLVACQGLAQAAPGSLGGWSKPVDGVEGRLCVAEGEPANDMGSISVDVELRNVSNNPVAIDIRDDPDTHFTVWNRQGKAVPSYPFCAIITGPGPSWRTLPHGGALLLHISTGGYSLPLDDGKDPSSRYMLGVFGGPYALSLIHI